MRSSLVFVLGLLVGSLVAPGLAQGDRYVDMNGQKHIGVSVEPAKFNETLAHYTQKMGFREMYSLTEDNGAPFLAYLQVDNNLFLELLPANADRRPGIHHFGIETPDVDAAAALLKGRGVNVEDTRFGRTKAKITFAIDPNGVNMELGTFGPESLQRQTADKLKTAK